MVYNRNRNVVTNDQLHNLRCKRGLVEFPNKTVALSGLVPLWFISRFGIEYLSFKGGFQGDFRRYNFQSPFCSPFNIEVFTFNSCFAIKGGRASKLLSNNSPVDFASPGEYFTGKARQVEWMWFLFYSPGELEVNGWKNGGCGLLILTAGKGCQSWY